MKLIYLQGGQLALKANRLVAIGYGEVTDSVEKFGVYAGFEGESKPLTAGTYSTADRASAAMDMLVMWLAADNDGKNIFYMPEDGEHLDVMVVEG